MKQVIVIVLGAIVLDAFAACSRERGEELFNKFQSCAEGTVVTNKGECVRTVKDDTGTYECWYSVDVGALRRVRMQRSDGGVDLYDYRGGFLQSSGCSSADRHSLVTTIFFGDGKNTNCVDRMESDSVDGKSVGEVRLLDVHGNRRGGDSTSQVSLMQKLWDVEYIPKAGSTCKIGPYEWTIIEARRGSFREALTRTGKKLVEASFDLGGAYPWIVGFAYEDSRSTNRPELADNGIRPLDEYSGVNYYFVIDIRDDRVMYIPFEGDFNKEIEKITGKSGKEYAKWSFWSYFLSRSGPKRLAKLEEALKPPAKVSMTFFCAPLEGHSSPFFTTVSAKRGSSPS